VAEQHSDQAATSGNESYKLTELRARRAVQTSLHYARTPRCTMKAAWRSGSDEQSGSSGNSGAIEASFTCAAPPGCRVLAKWPSPKRPARRPRTPVRLYGLGPPPPRSKRPSAQWVGGRLASLLPDDLEVGAADEWGPEGLRFRIAHPPTRLHVYGSVRRIATSAEALDAITVALRDALGRLRSAVNEATPPV
jgi:hypothetical protein